MCAIIRSKLFLIAGLLFSLAIVQLNATEYPSPPPVPAKFENAKEIQSYLSKLHTYYMIVGRPRFGKRSFQQNIIKSDPSECTEEDSDDSKLLVEALELLNNWNEQIKKNEYTQRIRDKIFKQYEK